MTHFTAGSAGIRKRLPLIPSSPTRTTLERGFLIESSIQSINRCVVV